MVPIISSPNTLFETDCSPAACFFFIRIMKTFTRDYRIPHFESKIFDCYFGGRKLCVFDIETTGLSRTTGKVILTAMLTLTDSGVRVTQFLAENYYEENRVIKATLDFIKEEKIDYLVTYNGLNFDIPFFNARCEAVLPGSKLRLYNLDLYKFLRKHSCLPDRMSSMSQKSVEYYFGISKTREDVINGAESVKLYSEYAKTGNTVIEKLILTHNREDVTQLYTLLLLAGKRDFEDILKCSCLHEAFACYGFPNGDTVIRAAFDIKHKALRINGDQLANSVSVELFNDEEQKYTASFNKELNSITATVQIETYNEIPFINIKALGLNEELRELDSYENGFLILGDGEKLDYKSLNAFSVAFVNMIIDRYC